MGAVKRKKSQSQEKDGTPFSEVNCKKDDFVKIVHRGIDSSRVFEEAMKEYSKLSPKEQQIAYKKVLYLLKDYPTETPYALEHSPGNIPVYYLDNMSEETIKILNAINKMNGIEKSVAAVEKIKERFFAKDDTQANWSRLLAVWLFERNHDSEDKVKCSKENAILEDFMTNYFKTRPSPKFTECDTDDLGEWDTYPSTKESKENGWANKPLLIFTDPLYMQDIMRRKPYQYVRKKITRELLKLQKEYGKALTLEQIKSMLKDKKLKTANFKYTGPMTATNEYCMLEAFLGSYTTTIKLDSWDSEFDILKLKVTTENRSHWESAARFPGVLKNYGFPDYIFHNTVRDDDLEDENKLHLLQTPLYFLPMLTTALDSVVALGGAAIGVVYNKDDENATAKDSAIKGSAATFAMYKGMGIGYVAHFKYGGTFIQRFEGEDSIQINKDLWLKETVVYFNHDKSGLDGFRRDQALPILNNLVADAKGRGCKLRAEVKGFADATGAEAYNKGLSQKRADTIMNYLGSKLELYEASSLGYGESKEHLLMPSMPESPLNRRVEILIEEII